jgi:two-component system, NarL family, sensor kinase
MLIFISIILLFAWIHQKNKSIEDTLHLKTQKKNLKKMLRSNMLREENEKKQLIQDLHDDIGAQLSATKMYLEAVCEDSDQKNKKKLNEVSLMLNEALKSIRNISKRIIPPLILKYGLAKAIDYLLNDLQKIGKIDFVFVSKKYVKSDDFLEIMLFRITQEIINNIMKHSNSNQIIVRLENDKNQLVLEIWDNGKPFDLPKEIHSNQHHTSKNGLRNIYSRVKNINATLLYQHHEGKNKIAIVHQSNSSEV